MTDFRRIGGALALAFIVLAGFALAGCAHHDDSYRGVACVMDGKC